MKIGVLGVGHLGKIHIKLLKEIKCFDLVGFYDLNKTVAQQVSQEFSVKSFDSYQKLFNQVEVIDIVTPTVTHFELAKKALNQRKHVFVEKPVTANTFEANILLEMAQNMTTCFQVGHVERFNPAYLAALPYINNPRFLEVHRLAMFNPRGIDVSVVLDLMIHDIDIILSMVNSKVKNIDASGVNIISDSPDISNARITFENGSVVNITSSRISIKDMRKIRLFQDGAYMTIDFLNKKTEITKIKDVQDSSVSPFSIVLESPGGNKEISFDRPEVKKNNAIKEELKSFYQAIVSNTRPIVSLTDGYNALVVAEEIVRQMDIKK